MSLFADFLWFWFRVITAPLVFVGALLGFAAMAVFSLVMSAILGVVASGLAAVAWVAQP